MLCQSRDLNRACQHPCQALGKCVLLYSTAWINQHQLLGAQEEQVTQGSCQIVIDLRHM